MQNPDRLLQDQGFKGKIPPSNCDNYLLVFWREMGFIGKAMFSQA
jgi:hypothetical protein